MSIILVGLNRLNRFTSSLLFLGILIFGNLISHSLFAQSPYTSVASGAWNVDATWSGTGFPVAGDVVTIANGHTITIPVAAACATLTLNGSGRVNHTANVALSVSGNMTMNTTSQVSPATAGGGRILNVGGTFSVSAGATNAILGGLQVNINGAGPHTIAGTLTLNNDAGVKTFNSLSISGSWTSTAVTTSGNLIFRAGVSSTGTFTAGSATFSTADQSIGGNAAMSFADIVTISGATVDVTNSNTNTVTMSRGGAATLTGTAGASFIQGANSTLSYAGSTINGITLTATSSPNAVTYTGASAAITATTYHNLTVNGTGTATVGGTTTVNSTMTVSSATTNNSTLTVTTALSGANTLTQGTTGILNIGGTSAITTLAATATGNTVNFTGVAQTVKSTTYYNLGLSGSGNKTFSVATTISGNLSIAGTAVANLGAGLTHASNSLTLGGAGQFPGSYGGTASSATFKNNTYFLSTSTGILNVCSVIPGTPTTYYSRNTTLGGNWNDANSWTTSSDGTGGPLAAGVWPRRIDNVVVRSGHTITIDDIDDNYSCGVSPDALGRSNVGPVASIPMFYQTGDLAVIGTLAVNGVEIMVEGYTHFTSTSTVSLGSTLVNLGNLEVDAGAVMSGLDDMILSGTSTTTINTNSTLADDIIIDWNTATLCGTGTTALTTNGGSRITYLHTATIAQICTTFRITCPNGGCAGGAPTFGTTVVLQGITGPGGIGNSLYNRLWLRAHDITGVANGGAVGGTAGTSWNDFSGNGLSAANTTGAEQPSFRTTPIAPTTSANGFPFVTFDGTADNLSLGAPAVLNFVPGTDSWSFFTVFSSPVAGPNAGTQNPNQGTLFSKAWNTGNRNYQYQIDDIDGTNSAIASYIGSGPLTGGTVACNNNAWTVFSHTNNTANRSSWTNEATNVTANAFGTGTEPLTEVLIGARRDTGPTVGEGFWYAGSIAEIIMYNREVNTAQRIIIDNYLSAKYATTLTANDVYTRDNGVAPNNFDYEVAGIGQAADGTSQKDAKGTGIVRIWNADGLGNNEFLMWGHNNTALTSSNTTDVLAPVQERLSRVWSVSELNIAGAAVDVGTVSVSFDINLFAHGFVGSNLRLLIDRDNDGFNDNDVTPLEGSFVGNTVVFSGVTFNNGDQFTLGNTDATQSLPIELVRFSATPENHTVRVDWVTASETDNEFFTVERSKNAQEWEIVRTLPGAGTSKVKNHYETVDDGPYTGTSYYRLKQTDFDKNVSHSGLVRVVLDYETPITLYPNPFSNNFTIAAEFEINPKQVKLYNSNGIEMAITVKKDGQQVIADPGAIRPGLYFLKVTDGFVTKTLKIIKKQSD